MLTPPIEVLIVDDHPVVRDGVAAQLHLHSDIRVVGRSATGAQAVADCERLRPDVVVLDLRLPDRTAPDVVPDLRRVCPEVRILLFTAFPDHVSVAPTFAAGANGLVVKDATMATLADAIRDVARTGHYDGTTTPHPDAGCTTLAVSHREYDVLRLVASGLTNAEIAEALSLSPNTVKAYLSTVMRKLDARNRAQVITQARTHGLL